MGEVMSKQRETQKERSAHRVMYDQVSELPLVIIHHILSSLETKEAARTSVLSAGWRTAWSTRPFLDFDQADFGAIPFQKKYDPRMEDMLLKFIDDTLESYHRNGIPILKLRIHVSAVAPCKLFPLMKKWLQIVPQSGVAELDFNTRWEESELPTEIFRAKSLRVLKVTSQVYGYKLVLGNNNVINCRNLKKLELDGIIVDGVTIHDLASHCPLIEELQLKDFGWPDIRIANLPNLRTLRLDCLGVKTVYIDAPSLQSLICRCAGELDVGQSGNLMSLSLSDSPIVDVQLQNILSNNPRIEDLNLFSCTMLERINASRVFLQRFRLSGCRKLVEVVIDAPNLLLLEYHYLCRTPLPVARTTTKGASNISIYCCGEIDASWFHMLREFLTKFRVSNVEITSYQDIKFDSVGFRAIPLSRGHAVEMLKINYEQSISVAHLDALFSICHPKTVLCAYADTIANKASVKSFCNELRNKKNHRCCDSYQMKCWRHYLNDARFHVPCDEPMRHRLIRKEISLEWKSVD